MQEELKKSMFEHLLKISNGKLLLNSEQLASIVGISAKQQSELRQNNEFPIKYKKIGKLVFYAINDVIDYLFTGETQIKKKEEQKPVVIKKNNKKIVDVSNIFMMKSFANALEQESQRLKQLSENLNIVSSKIEFHNHLTSKLQQKNNANN